MEPARQALDNPSYRLIVTDADTIATRTDPWDPATETSRGRRATPPHLASEQAEVLARAQARLDELIGLEGPKEQIAVWRTEIQIDQLLAAQGEETSSHQREPHGAGRPARHGENHASRASSPKSCSGWARFSAPTSRRSPRKTSSSATSRRPPSG